MAPSIIPYLDESRSTVGKKETDEHIEHVESADSSSDEIKEVQNDDGGSEHEPAVC